MNVSFFSLKKYFIVAGVFANVVLLMGSIFIINYVYSSGLSLPVFSEKLRQNLVINKPKLLPILSPVLNVFESLKVENFYFRPIEALGWVGIGANVNDNLSVDEYILVHNEETLLAALNTAVAGNSILIEPGTYSFEQFSIPLKNAGTQELPIKVLAKKLGTVKILLRGEGFVINKPHWQFTNLHLIGKCKIHSKCEHAFHIVGRGKHTLIQNNVLQDFNAMIKINGMRKIYPDYGIIINNTFFNSTPRETVNPVTPIDLMHANHWRVSGNFIYDIQKSSGDKTSYAAFFKGGSELGIFERNLVMCAATLPNNYTSVGLSLGGGGSLQAHRRNKSTAEHTGGIIRNNIVMHCANDVGIYLNRAKDSLIVHNTLYNTLGIDVRFEQSTAVINNNVISGRIKLRGNASFEENNNLVVSRGFITNEERLTEYFKAADIGDFSWKKAYPVSSKGKVIKPDQIDICEIQPSVEYIGAYSGNEFCLRALNFKRKHDGISL